MLDQTTDPDYYYHVAMSRYILEHGVPHTLPQVKGTGWDVLFSDKEFLFHQFTTLFYWLFGEIGLRILPVVISTGTMFICLLEALRRLPRKYFFIPFAIFVSEPYFLRRICMVRPQVLAVFFFTLLIYGLLRRKKYLVGLAAAGFTLSYHALQIPLMVLAAGVFSHSARDDERKKCLIALTLGLVVGILVNPYFPGNLMIIPQIFEIVLGAHVGDLPYGAEIYPWKANYVLNYSLVTFLLCGFALYTLGNAKGKNEESVNDHKMLLVLAGLFYAVNCLTPRGREYLVPCLFFLAVFAIENRARFQVWWKPIKVPFFAALAVAVAAQLLLVKTDYGFLKRKDAPPPLVEVMSHVPVTATGHVLNCNWSDSPFIFYTRPNLTFLDIMDPSFLVREAKPLHEARVDFVKGKFADPYFSAKYIFQANYVLCGDNEANLRLDRDPRFRRLYPATPVKNQTTSFALFEVKDESSRSPFVNHFAYRLRGGTDADWKDITPVMKRGNDEQKIDYFDFNRTFNKNILVENDKETVNEDGRKIETGSINCIEVKPAPQEIAAHAGAELVGLGGGPNLRAWLNNQPLFESYGEPATAAMIHTLIPLPKPLTARDELKILVCPGVKSTFYGTAVSFFTRATVDHICEEKGSVDQLSHRSALAWAFKGDSVKTCLGTMAARR